MSILNFIKNYGLVKGDQASEGLVNLAAALDAEGVSEAAIAQKQDEHAALVQKLVEAQFDFKKEKADFDRVSEEYNKKIAAAERAQADLTANPANADAATAVAELVAAIEKVAPRLDKEKAEYEQAERWMKELQEASDEVATELLGLRQQINETKAAIKEAELDADKALKNKQKAEQLAGLRKSGNKFDVALNALKAQAQAKQSEADANRIMAEQLRVPVTQVSSAASKYLEDTKVEVSTESLQDKLARLKAKA